MDNLAQGKILVTGADGFIGSHLTEALVSAGADVRAVVQYNSLGRRGWLDYVPQSVAGSIETVAGDVRDRGFMRDATKGCRVVLHLASLIAIPYSYQAPQSYLETNVGGLLAALDAARDVGVDHFIHTSTSEVYGTAQRTPIDENHPLQAQSPYAASKIAADQFALSYHRSFGLPVTVIRPFNAYGPRQSARAVIPTVIIQLLQGRERIQLGALHPTRDFSYVADTAAGFVAAVRAGERAFGEVVNIGSGFEISIGDAAALIAEVAGRPSAVDLDAARMRPADSEVERLLADSSKAGKLLEWRPVYGGLDGFRRGIERTVEWFREPANLAFYRDGYQT